MLGKTQLNVRLEEDLVKELRVEAAQMGLRLGTYIELILGKRQEILK
jgi:predicted DNA binding CopG/RHH family protein